jgi:hypothetical protein
MTGGGFASRFLPLPSSTTILAKEKRKLVITPVNVS